MFEVQLTMAEIAVCRMLGNARTIAARAGSVNDKQMGKQPAFEIDEDGVIGEYAFCKAKNIFFDPSASPRSGSYDCVLMGKRLDIKTTRYAQGRLAVTTKRNPDVDIFVLALYDPATHKVTFPGYVLADRLYQSENLKDLGHGQSYVMEQSKLNQWKTDDV